MKRVRIIFEYLLAFLIVSTLLLAIASVVIAKFYGNDVQSYIISEINEKIDTKIYVEQVNISVLRKFPFTSIVLEDITVWSSHNIRIDEFSDDSSDTLLHAETVYLSFNILDLLRKKYSVKRFEVKNGSLFILTDSKGEGNYKFLKKQKEQTGKDKVFELNEVKLTNIEYSLNNLSKKLSTSGTINELKLYGKFYRKIYQLKAETNFYIRQLTNQDIIYADNQTVGVKINLDVSDSLYKIVDGSIQIDKIEAKSSGSFTILKGGGVNLNVKTQTKNADFHSLLELIPVNLNERMRSLNGAGKIDLNTTVEGLFTSTQTPYINADFITKNVSLRLEQIPLEIKNLDIKGNYNNGSRHNPVTTTLRFEEFKAEIDKDNIQGSLLLTNFFSPEFNIELNGNINPSSWLERFKYLPVEKAGGEILPQLVINGSYNRDASAEQRSIEFNINGSVGFNDVHFKLANNKIPFKKLSGNINIKNDLWEPSFSGVYGSSDFRIEGTGLNLISYFLKPGSPLIVSANFYSEYFDLHQILQNISSSSDAEKDGVQFPENLNIRLYFSVSEFLKDRFEAQNVRGTISYDSPILFIDSLSMQTMGGTMTGNMGLTQDNSGKIYANISSGLYNLNIQDLFYSFNNFGQKQITNENIRGTVSGSTEFAATFTNNFKINKKEIISENEIIIRDGELNNFEPIMALSKFIDVRELENIHFATLHNTILINDNKVIIPQMDIQSNALNLAASGTHSLDNNYEYRVRLLLSELLYKQAHKSENMEYAVAQDESDTRMLFLKIYNTGGVVEVEYDRERAVEKIREDLKQEKAELKIILNEELGMFQNDEEIKKQRESTSGQEQLFKFDFNENEKDTVPVDSKQKQERFWKKNRR